MDTGAESVETDVDVFIATVDLLDVVDGAGAFGREGGDEEGDSGADVRGKHLSGSQPEFVVVSDDDGTMRIAENDLSPHVDQFVCEEETALEHLLMDQTTSMTESRSGVSPGHGASAIVIIEPSRKDSIW